MSLALLPSIFFIVSVSSSSVICLSVKGGMVWDGVGWLSSSMWSSWFFGIVCVVLCPIVM